MRTELEYEVLKPSEDNVRKSMRNIPALADSIHRHGLLENLVVVEPSLSFPYYQVKAGNRRYFAIGLLIDSGRWAKKQKVPVLVHSEQADPWPMLVENIQREEVPIWQLGHRFNELVEMNYTQEEIAANIGKAQGWISRALRISQGLSPVTIELIEKTGAKLTVRELQRCAALKDKDGEPDDAKQDKFVRSHMGLRPGRRKNKKIFGNKEVLFQRFKYLRDEMKVPPGARPVVKAVLQYLSGNVSRIQWPRKFRDLADMDDGDSEPMTVAEFNDVAESA